ncbi:hypothetical protein B0I35DRAFT_472833 [Stachybotrys elegans]|uniref:BZIP domain-containing protein n=1 Tax=Stachybotrys elegans TaxID=80388 RepID=A0A8K0T4V3_9HYPO|nr:hypothetical protein B0I35DRAFT_472833 [Stachybotrys elegans]
MSSSAHRANLARIRENQRRSRARRREYLQELEQRLRLCELQGVEASAEVQLAARRVAEENRQLRVLLNRFGLGDENIEQYLQAGVVPHPDQASTQPFTTGTPGVAVQSLQQLAMPRKPACLENSGSFTSTTQRSRASSTVSVSTNPSSWDSTPPIGAYSYCPPTQPLNSLSQVAVTLPPSYSMPTVSDTSTPRIDSFSSHPNGLTLDHLNQGNYDHGFLPIGEQSQLEYKATSFDSGHLVANCGTSGCFCG